MSLAGGRWLRDHEPTPVVLINEALARREYPGDDPIGRRIRVDWRGDDAFATIVGVVRDLKYTRLDADAPPEMFVPHAATNLFGVTLLMRIDGDPLSAAPGITQALASVDPTQSFFEVKTMEQALAASIAPRRFNLLLLGTFALVALALAALGVYGVIAYAVASRTHEIGIRLALGAERARVVSLIVCQGLTSVVAGVAVGLGAAIWATQLMATLLYDVNASDLPTFVAATCVLTVTAFVACAVPALKAALIDPARALRAE
jgi:putative ABC transport system permease protein